MKLALQNIVSTFVVSLFALSWVLYAIPVSANSNSLEIEAEVIGGITYVYVEEDGDEDEYVYYSDDKNTVLEDLSEDLDMSESDVEDALEYVDPEEEWEIEAQFTSGDDIYIYVDTGRDEEKLILDSDDLDDEDDEEDIIDWVADELSLPKSFIREVIEFSDYEEDEGEGDIEEINAERYEQIDGKWEVEVEYENDDKKFYVYNIDDEDELISEIADELGIDEDEVEDLLDYDEEEFGDEDEDEDNDFDEDEWEEFFEFIIALAIIEELAEEFNLDEDDVMEFVEDQEDEELDDDDFIEMFSEEFDVDEDDLEDFIEDLEDEFEDEDDEDMEDEDEDEMSDSMSLSDKDEQIAQLQEQLQQLLQLLIALLVAQLGGV